MPDPSKTPEENLDNPTIYGEYEPTGFRFHPPTGRVVIVGLLDEGPAEVVGRYANIIVNKENVPKLIESLQGCMASTGGERDG